MKRREFIIKSVAGGFALTLPFGLSALNNSRIKPTAFAVCADVHHDIMHDAEVRMQQFIKAAKETNSDFIIQLGDFCRPYEKNKLFLDIFNGFPGEKHHVIGNHDMDGGFSREDVLKFWSSPAKYYSFDLNGIHFVILDGNDKNPSEKRASGYARYIGHEQKEWLRADLNETQNHVLIFSHQSLEDEEGVENRTEIQSILTEANDNAGFNKVVACFSGHHHTDYYTTVNDIYYIQINSMSYSWLGDKYKTIRYSAEIDKQYPWIKYTVPYLEPIWAMVKVKDGQIKIEGRSTEFVGIGPEELGVLTNEKNPIIPKISNQKLKF